MAGEYDEAGLSQGDAADRGGVGGGGGQRVPADGGRSPTPLPGDRRPQLVAQVAQLIEDVEALLGGRHHLVVEAGEAGEERVSPDLQDQAVGGAEPGPTAVGEQAAVAQRRRPTSDQPPVPVGGGRTTGAVAWAERSVVRRAGHRRLHGSRGVGGARPRSAPRTSWLASWQGGATVGPPPPTPARSGLPAPPHRAPAGRRTANRRRIAVRRVAERGWQGRGRLVHGARRTSAVVRGRGPGAERAHSGLTGPPLLPGPGQPAGANPAVQAACSAR